MLRIKLLPTFTIVVSVRLGRLSQNGSHVCDRSNNIGTHNERIIDNEFLSASIILHVFGETNQLREKEISFLLLCYLFCRAKMPPSKFEANPTLRLRVKRSSLFH